VGFYRFEVLSDRLIIHRNFRVEKGLMPAEVPVKDGKRVLARREQITRVALTLFLDRGYHNTTVREIAQAADLSVGSLFNYFRSKGEILHFLYDQAHMAVEAAIQDALDPSPDPEAAFRKAFGRFLQVVDRYQTHVLLVYQEFKSLDASAKKLVMDRERRIAEIFQRIVEAGIAAGCFAPRALPVAVHDILVMGHLWALRRWALRHGFSFEAFLAHQTELALAMLKGAPGERA
jgi:AcrR family transcriptional regulator